MALNRADFTSAGLTLGLLSYDLGRRCSFQAPVREGARTAATSAGVKAKQRFSDDILVDFRKSKGLRIRAGTGPHRFIGIWEVVVNDRVFVRSWSVKPLGWYRTFLEEPRGTVQIADREIAVRAVRTRDKRVKDAVDRAYLDKYNTPGANKYARDLGSAKSRATTLELKPFAPISRWVLTGRVV
jgi:hypothetical protein